jgi:hypothetical protein
MTYTYDTSQGEELMDAKEKESAETILQIRLELSTAKALVDKLNGRLEGLSRKTSQVCITIIDTIIHHILHIYTNNAHIYTNNLPGRGGTGGKRSGEPGGKAANHCADPGRQCGEE